VIGRRSADEGALDGIGARSLKFRSMVLPDVFSIMKAGKTLRSGAGLHEERHLPMPLATSFAADSSATSDALRALIA